MPGPSSSFIRSHDPVDHRDGAEDDARAHALDGQLADRTGRRDQVDLHQPGGARGEGVERGLDAGGDGAARGTRRPPRSRRRWSRCRSRRRCRGRRSGGRPRPRSPGGRRRARAGCRSPARCPCARPARSGCASRCRYLRASDWYSVESCGTTEATTISSSSPRLPPRRRRIWSWCAASSSAVAPRSVEMRHSCSRSSPWYTPAWVCVFPTSIARSMVTRRCRPAPPRRASAGSPPSRPGWCRSRPSG